MLNLQESEEVMERHVGALAVLALLQIPAPAQANMLWEIVADCSKSHETVFDVRCTGMFDCPVGLSALYGCRHGDEPVSLSSALLVWSAAKEVCKCMPSYTDPQDETVCPDGDELECRWGATTVIPHGCDELDYSGICSDSSRCGDFGGTYCSAGTTFLNKGTGGTGGTGGNTISEEEGESGGCSISVRTANVTLFTMLLLALGISWLVSRRGSRADG